MNFREIFRIIGTFLFAFGITLVLPIGFAIYEEFYLLVEHPHPTLIPFILTSVTAFVLAGLFRFWGRSADGKGMFRKEGLACVVLIWALAPAIACLPFLLSGTLKSPIQAYFEATSGLTTTGASLLMAKRFDQKTGKEIPYERVIRGEFDTQYRFYGTVDPVKNKQGEVIAEGIEAVARPLLLWRSFLQWLGGLGIIVLFVAILPALGVGGKILFHTEMPGPVKETLTPRLKETAMILWKIYVGLSLVEIALLYFTHSAIGLYDACALTFSTISTGGFTVRNGSIAAYNSPTTEWIIILFMLVGSINFSLYFYCLRGKIYRLWETELIVYLLVLFVGGLFASWYLMGTEKISLVEGSVGMFGVADSFRTGFFQVISAQTSTGFATTNYDKWPFVVQALMLIMIYLGGMSGSTAGGIKMMRHIMVFRFVQDKVEMMYRPETVRTFRIGDRSVSQYAATVVLCFLLTVISLAALGTFLLVLSGLDPETSLTVITSTINNSGMGFREAGPTDSYAFLPNFGLILTTAWMIMGRLEFFAVLVMLIPAFWKKV